MKKWLIILFCACSWLCIPFQVKAQADVQDYFDYREVDQILEEIFPEGKLKFSELVSSITEGEFSWASLWKFFCQQFTYEFQNARKSLVQILLIVIVAAVFHNFSEVFQSQQTAEIGFLALYMIFVTICIGTFHSLLEAVSEGLTKLLNFFSALGPVYFMGVAITTGSATSIAFYNILLFIIYLAELLVNRLLLPLVQTFFVFRILNEMSKEEYLSKFGDLIQMLIKWILRVFLAGVVGISVIQGMLSPAIDSVKRSALLRGGEALPILGDAIGGVTEVMLGTAVLIRNGIGIAGVVICLAICLVPTLQMAGIVILYRLAAAVVQPISEKRMVNCIGNMADGASLLLQIILTSCALFLIVIAIVANTT